MIRFQRPRLPDAAHVEAYLSWSREQRWFSNDGPCAKELRVRLEAAMGEKVQVALLGSGTLALMVTLRALLGDAAAARPYVVVPSYTFVATAAAIAWCGRIPLFADVEPEGWHLDPEALDAVLAEQEGQVDAILACATFGTPPPAATVARWRVAAERHGVPLMIDTAAGFGATGRDGGIHGGVEAPEVFSFHATKPFAIGEGGMVATVDGALAARIRRLANFGFDEEREVVESFGLNAKMSELHASVALAVLDGFDGVLAARRRRAERLRSRLEPAGFIFQAGSARSAWQFVPVLAPDMTTRDAVLDRARREQVEMRTYHTPLHLARPYAWAPRGRSLDVTTDLSQRTLSLPLADDLSDEELDRVAEVVIAA